MPYAKAVHNAHLILDLCGKSRKKIKELFEPPDNDVESIRLRTDQYEMIIAQHNNFTLIVTQEDSTKMSEVVEGEAGEEKTS
jgi:hypothetical protein